MPFHNWAAMEEVDAPDFQNLVGNQIVATFDDDAQRTAQLPAPITGQLSTLDTYRGALWIYNGTAWTEPVPYSQSGYHAQTLNGGGGGVITYPKPFAIGNVAMHMTNADDPGSGWGMQFAIIQAQNTAVDCGFVGRYTNGNIAADAPVKLMWSAFGYRAAD